MNLKNVSLYTSILLLVVGFGLLLQNVIVDLDEHSKAVFSVRSVEYMDNLVGSAETNRLTNITENTLGGYQEDNIFLAEEDEGSSDVTDNLANLNFFKKLQEKVINPIKFIFNVPAFILTLFNLPLSPFTALTALINLIFYIGIITMIVANLK